MIIALLPLQIPGVSFAATQAAAKQVANDNNSVSQPITLSLKDACQKAIDNTYSFKTMDKSIEKLWKQEDKAMTASNSIQEQLNKMDFYTRLYEKRAKGQTLTIEEQDQLLMYSYMFGDKPPLFSGQDMYEQFIKTRDITHYSVWAQIQDSKRSRDVAKLTLEDSIRNIYDTILYLTDLHSTTNQALQTMEKEYKDFLVQYKKGLVSEIDRYQCQIKLDKKKLELKKQERNIDNSKMQLKNMCGIPASQQITLAESDLSSDTQLLSYKAYCDKALENRNEIVAAKLELTVVTRENDIMKQYVTDSLNYDRMDLQQKVDNAEFSLSQNTDSVLEDMQWAYADIISKQTQVGIEKKAVASAKTNLAIAEKQYKLGQINILGVWNAKDTASMADISYRKAQRDFNYACYKINLASGLGPKYK